MNTKGFYLLVDSISLGNAAMDISETERHIYLFSTVHTWADINNDV